MMDDPMHEPGGAAHNVNPRPAGPRDWRPQWQNPIPEGQRGLAPGQPFERPQYRYPLDDVQITELPTRKK